MNENNLQFNVIFRSEPEGGFTASVPSLPGCISFGKDLTEAKNMIVDAIKGYIISLKKHKEVVVSDNEDYVSLISINQEIVHA
jgi:predicted RNase H-like HicB family nuclease